MSSPTVCLDEKIGILDRFKNDEDIEIQIQNALFDKSEELDSYFIKLNNKFDKCYSQTKIQNSDIEKCDDNEFKDNLNNEFKRKIYNRVINGLTIVTFLFLVLQSVVSVLVYMDYSIIDLDFDALTYYTVDVMIPFIGRLVIFMLMITLIGRLFIIAKVFKQEDISLKVAVFERQFVHYLTCSLYIWCIMLAVNIWYDTYFDPMQVHCTNGLKRPQLIKYSILVLDYSWFIITGISFVFYSVFEVIRFVGGV